MEFALKNCIKIWLAMGLIWTVNGRYIGQNSSLKVKKLDDLDLITRLSANLLLSEYNRVATTNPRLYVVSRDPSMFCEDNDLRMCLISLEILSTVCPRFSPWSANCKPLSGVTQTCFGSVNLMTANVINQLTCHETISSQSQHKDGEDPALTSMYGKVVDEFPKLYSQIFKKQWGETEDDGGNIYPMK